MFCPNCANELIKNPKHAESVWQCDNCSGRFYIIETSKPDDSLSLKDDIKFSIQEYLNGHISSDMALTQINNIL